MANVKISELNELTKSNKAYNDYLPIVDTSTNETKKISVEGLTASNVELLAVTTSPNIPTPIAGAKYYNTGDNKIYSAIDDERWINPQTPVAGIFYVVLEERTTYTYDEENETLVSVGGGGSGSEIVVGDEEPTEDTKMIIDTDAFNPQYSDITDEYSEASNMAYNCDYSNKAFGGTILWTNSSPTSNYGANEVSIADLSSYSIIKIIYNRSTSSVYQLEGSLYLIATTVGNPILFFDGSTQYLRNVSANKSTNKISFERCQTPGVGYHDNTIIPLYIIGYKTELFNQGGNN